jgi:hypothetical protein|nr:MAG TPA: hypothetical protein [Caudoviricetes sp.]
MEINTHGRKINLETLANASDSTKGLGSRTGEYMEIFYDKSTGDVWGKYHWDREEWTVYHDEDVIKVGLAIRFKTPQQIADMIDNTLTEDERNERENAEYLRGGAQA